MMNKRIGGLLGAIGISAAALFSSNYEARADGTNNLRATYISSTYDGTNNVTRVTYDGLIPGDNYVLQKRVNLSGTNSSDPNVEDKWVQVDSLTAARTKETVTDRSNSGKGLYRLMKK